VTTVTNVKAVKLYSKVTKIRVRKRFLAVFDMKLVSDIYNSYFDSAT